MPSRTRLRFRVFAITALYAAMLVGIAGVLTWRAGVSQRRFNRLLVVETGAIQQLERFQRDSLAFKRQWRALALIQPQNLVAFADRYPLVQQHLDSPRLEEVNTASLRQAAAAFETFVRLSAREWPKAGVEGREAIFLELENRWNAVDLQTQTLIRERKSEIDQTVPSLARATRNTMWTALGVAWMIAMFSFVLARITLSKVVKPLEDLSLVAQKLSDGDLDARVVPAGDREILQLGQTFNKMADELSGSMSRLEVRARTDELTGMPNFRAFRQAIAAEIERSARYQLTFGVLVFDLDYFKKYNDRHGHQAGNEALQAVAHTIRLTMRAVDFPARYGGDEFAAIYPQIDLKGLGVLAERVRSGVELLPPIEGRSTLTVSVGAALFPHDGLTAEELFEAADERLYRAKREGRNRVVMPPERKTKTA